MNNRYSVLIDSDNEEKEKPSNTKDHKQRNDKDNKYKTTNTHKHIPNKYIQQLNYIIKHNGITDYTEQQNDKNASVETCSESKRRKLYFTNFPKNVHISKVSNMLSDIKLSQSVRGGVIPINYIFLPIEKETLCANIFFLTRHSKGMLSDFGGLINEKEELLNGCYREFSEETFNYSIFTSRNNTICVNSDITSVIFNFIHNSDIVRSIYIYEYFTKDIFTGECETTIKKLYSENYLKYEYLKAYNVINYTVWNSLNIRLLYNQHRKVKINRGEDCSEIDGIVVVSNMLDFCCKSNKSTHDKHSYDNHSSDTNDQKNSTFKIFPPVKKLLQCCKPQDINKINSTFKQFKLDDKYIYMNALYTHNNKTLETKDIQIQSYKDIEKRIGNDIFNHITYINSIYLNSDIDIKNNKIENIHIMDITIKLFNHIIVSNSEFFKKYGVYSIGCTQNNDNDTIQETDINMLKITSCVISHLQNYIYSINNINLQYLDYVFDNNFVDKIPNTSLKEINHWIDNFKHTNIKDMKTIVKTINYPLEYILVYNDKTKNLLDNYNSEINVISNHVSSMLKDVLSVFCKKETVDWLFSV